MNVRAETNKKFSFNATRECKKPPISPSNKTLYKQYNIYTHFGAWKIYDINGDGWCDWVRGGNEGYRTDMDEPKMHDFIYLGTSSGWRYFDHLTTKKNSDIKIINHLDRDVISANDRAITFIEPIAVYAEAEAKPYIVVIVRYDAPAPPPDRNDIMVYRWDDQLDKLVQVSKKATTEVVDFLHEQLCKEPSALRTEFDSPFLISQGTLCYPRK